MTFILTNSVTPDLDELTECFKILKLLDHRTYIRVQRKYIEGMVMVKDKAGDPSLWDCCC